MSEGKMAHLQRVDISGSPVTTYVEVAPPAGDYQEVGLLDALPFADVVDAIATVTTSIGAALEKARPSKASVELGLEFGLEAGSFMVVIARGSSTANVKVTMEWTKD